MKYVRTRSAAPLMTLIAIAALASAQEAPLPQATTQGLLVLHNGNVIEGVVERLGERYRVLIGQGEIGVPVDKVRLVANSYDDAYRQMRVGQRNTVGGHIELAVWCIEHELFSQAADEILAAMKLDPNRKEIAITQRRLIARARSASANRHPGISRVPRVNAPPAASASPTIAELADQTNATKQAPSKLRLEDQPREVILQYRSEIMPLLVNSCGANRCHGHHESVAFALFRPLNRHVSKRVVERNWESTVKWIDPSRPTQSRILQMATRAHGGEKEPALKDDDPQLARLLVWVEKQGLQMAPPAKQPSGESRSVRQVNFESQGDRVAQPARTSDSAEAVPASAKGNSTAKEQPTTPITSTEQRDPFDPRPFNQRHHPNGPPKSSSPSAVPSSTVPSSTTPSPGSSSSPSVPTLPTIPRR